MLLLASMLPLPLCWGNVLWADTKGSTGLLGFQDALLYPTKIPFPIQRELVQAASCQGNNRLHGESRARQSAQGRRINEWL